MLNGPGFEHSRPHALRLAKLQDFRHHRIVELERYAIPRRSGGRLRRHDRHGIGIIGSGIGGLIESLGIPPDLRESGDLYRLLQKQDGEIENQLGIPTAEQRPNQKREPRSVSRPTNRQRGNQGPHHAVNRSKALGKTLPPYGRPKRRKRDQMSRFYSNRAHASLGHEKIRHF